uniref:Uncharacterized protein n=1 Tax=Chenopodium quinoa TaxID=63459 RepID=A0A803MM60_CHEQI
MAETPPSIREISEPSTNRNAGPDYLHSSSRIANNEGNSNYDSAENPDTTMHGKLAKRVHKVRPEIQNQRNLAFKKKAQKSSSHVVPGPCYDTPVTLQTGKKRKTQTKKAAVVVLKKQTVKLPTVRKPKKVLKLLLEKHPDLMDKVDEKKYNVLHQWVQLNKIWPFELLFEDFPATRSKFYRDLIYNAEGSQGDTPLHVTVTIENRDIAMALIKDYQQEMKYSGMSTDDSPPWRIKNFVGHTPLHVALSHKNEQLPMHLTNLDSKLCMILSNEGHNPLYDGVLTRCGTVVEEILRAQHDFFRMLRSNDGTTVLHLLKHVPDKIGRKLLKNFWWMTNVSDNKGRTALDEANEANIPWLKPSISELKNTTDHEGAMPLHRAILRKDMLLAKVLLLDDDVERNIEDYRGRNSMALLDKLVKEDKD